jgi:hypothetical protein
LLGRSRLGLARLASTTGLGQLRLHRCAGRIQWRLPPFGSTQDIRHGNRLHGLRWDLAELSTEL